MTVVDAVNRTGINESKKLILRDNIKKAYGLQNAFVLIFHGTLNYAPNMHAEENLTRLLPQIIKKYPNVYLLLMGKNPPKISSPHIILTGFVENPFDYIAIADLAVVPLTSGGGTKLKMLQYLACGKAIVATTKAAEGLELENNKDALICKNPDSELVNLVFKVIENPQLRKMLGANARKKAELLYDWEHNAQKAIAVYQNLISAQS
jgi:glycosyltransferase involved in cell wall biosynthesis